MSKSLIRMFLKKTFHYLFLFSIISSSALAQVKPSFSPGNSREIVFGNPQITEGQYSGSFLSPVLQSGAGNSPEDVKTTYFGGFGYTGKTLKEKNQESLERDQVDINSLYSKQIFSLFENNYFPSENWDGAPLVEKVYGILEGIKGDPNVATENAKKQRLFFPTGSQDLASWGDEVTRQQYQDKYKSYYGVEPSSQEISDFINTFYAIKNSIQWSGLCHQFSAANADPYITSKMSEIYKRDGETFLCLQPISLGELKEATTLLYDSVDVDQQIGKSSLYPYKETKYNNLKPDELNFYKNYPPNTFITAEELNDHRRKYASYVYQNYYERNGENPSGLDFCELDKQFLQNERQNYTSETDAFTKNKVPILNISGDGEIWNNPVNSVKRDVQPYNFYTGESAKIDELGNNQTSNSFLEMMKVYVDYKVKGKETDPTFKRMQKMLIRNQSVMCDFARTNNYEYSKGYCNEIVNNQSLDTPATGSENVQEWSSFPQLLKNQNDKVDKALFNLVKTFMVMGDNNLPMNDSSGLPVVRTLESQFFKKYKMQDVSLKVKYVNEADFAHEQKSANLEEKSFEGLVLVDDSVSPPSQVGCSWKSVWRYNHDLQQYESDVAGSFLTLDIPACPADTKATKLLNQVSKCITMKELVKAYNQWMLEASQGFEPAKIAAEIDAFKEKFPESNLDWVKLKKQILGDMADQFIEESAE